ncbi:MAG: cytochrome C, partial [Methylococcales bacterium]|nr:cytochrome C [Methylococcales bacterium]
MKITKKLLTKPFIASLAALVLPLGAQATAADAPKMHNLYEENCASCHGSDLGGFIAPGLNSETLKGRSPTALRSIIMT